MKTMKKRIASVSLALVLVLSFTGCGNTIPAMNEKDSEENTGEITEMGGDVTSLDEIIADADEPVEQSAEVDKIAEQTEESVETEEPAQTAEPDATEKPAATKKPVEPAQPTTSSKQTTAPAQNTTASTESAQSSAPANTPAPTPAATPTPEPVHEHVWKEHVVTNQVWVPNIVVVDDYEERTVTEWKATCYCGYTTSDPNDIKNHIKTNLTAEHNGFGVEEHTHTEQVKVGSHEEDQGHYETNSYVDYYYCDCGETK